MLTWAGPSGPPFRPSIRAWFQAPLQQPGFIPRPSVVPSFHVEIVHPQWMTLKSWADAFVYVMAHVLPLPWLTDEASFERWATQIAQEPNLSPYNIPYPQGRQWQEWALAVNNALSTASSS